MRLHDITRPTQAALLWIGDGHPCPGCDRAGIDPRQHHGHAADFFGIAQEVEDEDLAPYYCECPACENTLLAHYYIANYDDNDPYLCLDCTDRQCPEPPR